MRQTDIKIAVEFVLILELSYYAYSLARSLLLHWLHLVESLL